MSLSTTPPWFLNTSRDGDSTTLLMLQGEVLAASFSPPSFFKAPSPSWSQPSPMPTNSCPSVPHLHLSWTPPGTVTPPPPWAACSNASPLFLSSGSRLILPWNDLTPLPLILESISVVCGHTGEMMAREVSRGKVPPPEITNTKWNMGQKEGENIKKEWWGSCCSHNGQKQTRQGCCKK